MISDCSLTEFSGNIFALKLIVRNRGKNKFILRDKYVMEVQQFPFELAHQEQMSSNCLVCIEDLTQNNTNSQKQLEKVKKLDIYARLSSAGPYLIIWFFLSRLSKGELRQRVALFLNPSLQLNKKRIKDILYSRFQKSDKTITSKSKNKVGINQINRKKLR